MDLLSLANSVNILVVSNEFVVEIVKREREREREDKWCMTDSIFMFNY